MSAGVVPPFVAGSGVRSKGDEAPLAPPRDKEDDGESASADATDLPWISESLAALSGLATLGDELISASAEPVADAIDTEDAEPAEQWDDELGTFALSEELPELGTSSHSDELPEFGTVRRSEELPEPRGAGRGADEPPAEATLEGAWPNYALPIVTAPLPATALEGVAQRLERIARTLRERGPTGPLEEDASDPLGALITGYVLGMSGAEKGRE